MRCVVLSPESAKATAESIHSIGVVGINSGRVATFSSVYYWQYSPHYCSVNQVSHCSKLCKRCPVFFSIQCVCVCLYSSKKPLLLCSCCATNELMLGVENSSSSSRFRVYCQPVSQIRSRLSRAIHYQFTHGNRTNNKSKCVRCSWEAVAVFSLCTPLPVVATLKALYSLLLIIETHSLLMGFSHSFTNRLEGAITFSTLLGDYFLSHFAALKSVLPAAQQLV